MEKTIKPEIGELLKTGIIEGNIFKINAGQLDRKTYTELNEALENLGGKWSKKDKGHVFKESPSEKISAALGEGKTVNKKKLLQFFETPEVVAKRILELAEIKDGMMVLEPSAGHGAIAEAIVKYAGPLDIGLIMVEIDPEKCEVLKSKKIANVLCMDFMGSFAEEYGMFERVVMNPPFTKQQDIDHVMRAYDKCLYPGGRLVSVMSAGFTFRTNKKSVEFKKLVESKGFYEELPYGAFKESGTGVRTVIVVLNK